MAGITKKKSLRNKVVRTNSSKINEFKHENDQLNEEDGERHENPLLKLSKISKKEKMQSKSASFAETLLKKVTFNTSNNISKSSSRRRKRREKEELKPKMNELLSSLDDITKESQTTHIVVKDPATGGYVRAARANAPNANTKKGQQQIMKQEGENFKNVLKNPEFRSDPFAALKFAIQNNVNNSKNEVKVKK